MRIILLSWLFLIPLFHILLVSSGQCLSDQKGLLLQLNATLKINSFSTAKLANWNLSTDCCSWDGVGCDLQGHVVKLHLSNQTITGGLENSSLFSLGFLQILDLSNNWFNYTVISPNFNNLASLTYLNLSNAGFAGQIPSFSSLVRLVALDLSSLYFSGLPSLKLENPNLSMLVHDLTELQEIYLDGVNISVNGIPWAQALSSSLPHLQSLSLSSCSLSGPIDQSLKELQALSMIRLSQNNLAMSVPEFFAEFTNLTELRLSSCNLSGLFPEEIFRLPKLQIVDVSNNKMLQGSFPEFPQNSSFQTLVLGQTRFSGSLPESIGNLGKLSRMELNNCNFSRSLPKSMASLTQLVYLDFSFNSFIGSIPSFSLSKNLTYINLSYNNLTGEIDSSEWSHLGNLVLLDLSNNLLNGSIPLSLFFHPSIQKIQLSNNQFDGQFNNSLSRPSHLLDTLDLSSNNLQGPIPTFFFELLGLKTLSLSSNNFTGSLELSRIKNLRNLTSLDLSHNFLSIDAAESNFNLSSYPQITTLKLASCSLNVFPNFSDQPKLVYLDLSNNKISGDIPLWVWSIGHGLPGYLNLSYNMLKGFEEPLPLVAPDLSILDLHFNLLQGAIRIQTPSAIILDYSNNNFSSNIPADIGNNPSYTLFLSLSNNGLTGSIPHSICNATDLAVLDLSNNALTGGIPPCVIELGKNLGVLNLRGNRLSGEVPKVFPSNCMLKTFDISSNLFEGPIPRSLSNCQQMEILNLGYNSINDGFPCFLRNLSSLQVLVLRSNQFHGNISCAVTNQSWPNLQIIDIASNKFIGRLPSMCSLNWNAMTANEDITQLAYKHLRFEILQLKKFYYQDTVTVTNKGQDMELVKILTVFTSIDLSSNGFEGNIPSAVGNLKSLYVLNLSYNALTGKIPPSIGNLTQLESLDLSRNNLSGEIPQELVRLNFLSVLNLSFNKLVGRIPEGSQFHTFTDASFLGNQGLCGPPLNTSCNVLKPPASSSATPSKKSATDFCWQSIFTGLGFGIGAGYVVGLLMFWQQARNWFDQQMSDFLLIIFPTYRFKYFSHDKAEENTEEEPLDNSDDSDEEQDEDDPESEAIRGRYCVFCTKLDFGRKKAIHNPNCTCHDPLPISSSSSFSSSSQLHVTTY